MIWKQNREITSEYIEELAREFETNELLVRILLNRKNDKEFARIALRDLYEAIIPAERLVNGQAVADVIARHIRNGSKIYIHADYDADGLNSGFIMYETIKEVIEVAQSNAYVEVYFPERINGYGLSFDFANNLIQTKGDEDILVITVDNGIAQVEQVELLMNNGIEVVVTDHHMSKEDGIPNCLICDPHNEYIEQDDTFKHLCGAGVAFKVCELLQKNFGYHDMYRFVTNVAIATITDVMPLNAENMAFVRYGLDIINSEYCPVGIKAMKEFLGITVMNSANIAWEIGPRLNACGRMNNTKIGGALLMETDYHMAVDLVNEIELINESRKEKTKEAEEQLSSMNFDNDYVCIIKLEELPEGIVGIIAGRAAERLGKPSIVVTESEDGICKGSARSIPGLDLHYLFNIEVSKGNIENFGGHSEAAGISFREDKLEELKASLNESIQNLALSQQHDLSVVEEEPVLMIDECIEIKHLNQNTFNLINELPYDKDTFAKPVFALVDCEVKDFVPTKTKPENLWLTVKQGKQTVKLWCQGMTEVYKSKGCPKVIHLAGYIEKNFMSGRPYILKVIDIADAS
jgi:single-stranded-DNA-specific exonuclease